MYMTINFTSFNHSLYSFSLWGKLWRRCAIFGLTLFFTNIDLVHAPYFSNTYNNVFSHIIFRWVMEFPTRGYKSNVLLPKMGFKETAVICELVKVH